MKTQFPTLSGSQIYNYNSSSVCDMQAAAELKHYYNYDKKTKTIELSGLDKEHFDSKLYKNVTEGSLRWWLLEMRKFDYSLIEREALCSGDKITTTKILKHEYNWVKKVDDWYTKYTTGVNKDTATTIGTASSTSKYMLNSHSDNGTELTIAQAIAIGKDSKGDPKFYQLITDAEGEEDLICGVKPQDLRNIKDTKRLTEKWWILERMRYDYGNGTHPVATDFGMVSGDWKGIVYKYMNGLHNINNTDIISYHERGWIQWVNAVYANWYNEPNTNNSFRHNMAVIARLDPTQLQEIASVCPEYIIEHMPTKLYADVIEHILKTIDDEGRFNYSEKKSINQIIKYLLPKIKVYPTSPSGCSNINLSNVITAISSIDPHGNLDIAQIIAAKAIQYNMITGNNSALLSKELLSLNPKKPIRQQTYGIFDSYCKKQGITPNEFWSTDADHLNGLLKSIEAPKEEVKQKYNLM